MAMIGLTLAGCTSEDDDVDQAAIKCTLGALMHPETEEVQRLATGGIGPDERPSDDNGIPMMRAAQTGQWPVVEILIDHGADIRAHDMFGITAAQRTLTSRILRGSDKARLHAIGTLKARGYPHPPPARDEILAIDKAGAWPPRGVAR